MLYYSLKLQRPFYDQVVPSETYPSVTQTSKMKSFAAIVHAFQPLTIIAKLFILDFFGALNHLWLLILVSTLVIHQFFHDVFRNRNYFGKSPNETSVLVKLMQYLGTSHNIYLA